MVLTVDWLSCDPNVRLVPNWDDGHVPETFRTPPPDNKADPIPRPEDEDINEERTVHRKDTAQTLLVWRPHTFHSPSSSLSASENWVHVVDGALPSALVEAMYRVTVNQKDPSWGTYVPIERVLDPNNDPWGCVDARFEFDNGTDPQPSIDRLATLACSAYFRHALRKDGGLLRKLLQRDQHYMDETNQQTTDPDEDEAIKSACTRTLHGVAVWALSSTTQSSVPYHVDYAEQVRYCHNVVVLPHLAGTLHCSNVSDMMGGDLVVYHSFQHYERHGYKACKEAISPIDEDPSVARVIPYRFNRMVVMAGHLPHASTPIEKILPQDCRRVIVGFNVFGHDVGGIVQAAPEHSATWKRQVKLLRLQQRQERNRIPVSIGSISQLPPSVRKVLVLAKRRKVKDEWRREYLSHRLQEVLRECDVNTVTELELAQRIVSHSASSASAWPTQHDVQLFLREHYVPPASQLSKPGA